MNILPFIPPGWLTAIGAIIKILSAVLAILTAIQGGDLQTILQHLSAALGVYGAGSATTALGLRRAIARSIPISVTLDTGIAHDAAS